MGITASLMGAREYPSALSGQSLRNKMGQEGVQRTYSLLTTNQLLRGSRIVTLGQGYLVLKLNPFAAFWKLNTRNLTEPFPLGPLP